MVADSYGPTHVEGAVEILAITGRFYWMCLQHYRNDTTVLVLGIDILVDEVARTLGLATSHYPLFIFNKTSSLNLLTPRLSDAPIKPLMQCIYYVYVLSFAREATDLRCSDTRVTRKLHIMPRYTK